MLYRGKARNWEVVPTGKGQGLLVEALKVAVAFCVLYALAVVLFSL